MKRREFIALPLEGDQCRSLGDWTASATAKPCRGGGVSEQDGAHRPGGAPAVGRRHRHLRDKLGPQRAKLGHDPIDVLEQIRPGSRHGGNF
jgi:hypothetical protein